LSGGGGGGVGFDGILEGGDLGLTWPGRKGWGSSSRGYGEKQRWKCQKSKEKEPGKGAADTS